MKARPVSFLASLLIAATAAAEDDTSLWSLRPIEKPAVPEVKNESWPRTPVDRFILRKLESAGLTPAPDAAPRTLLRRAHFDLTGLPPSERAIRSFVDDPSPRAFKKVVDRLLASPHFGERWGRHWLDVARYANSSGGGRALLLERAWRYRDYVVEAFNENKPYDAFVREQIAGDLLDASTVEEKRDHLVATAFLMLGPNNYELQDKELLRMEVVDEQIKTMGQAILGMTLGCARCHDHKFDPVPTEDYYALAGIFRSTKMLTPGNVSGWTKRELPVGGERAEALKKHRKAVEKAKGRLKEAKQTVDTVENKLPTVEVDDGEAKLTGDWSKSDSVGGFVGDHYRYAGGKGATARFELPIERDGRYRVLVSYAAHGNRGDRVPVSVTHAEGEAKKRVDQTTEPPVDGLYEAVGTYRFTSDGPATVVISAKGAGGLAVADAVRAMPVALDDPLPESYAMPADPSAIRGVVVDDTEAKITGDWKDSTHVPNYVGKGYIHDDRNKSPERSVTFVPDIPESGVYEVRVSYTPGNSRAEAVPVTVRHAEGKTTRRLDQRAEPTVAKLFEPVGRFRFEKGEKGFVRVSNRGTSGHVIADAAQFVRVEQRDGPAADRLARLRDRLTEAREKVDQVEEKLAKLEKNAPPAPPKAMAVREQPDPGDYRVAVRGDVHNLGKKVERGFLSAITEKKPDIKGESGRRELARWLTSRDNPLTARVMVNRIWHHLFGEGIVRSVDNFGKKGGDPSHPALLDWLAARFMEEDWSVKSMIRLIMRSRVYQLSTESTERLEKVDPDNRLLARMNRRRLEAEAIRDAMLAVSGTLDRSQGGRTMPKDLSSEFDYNFDTRRRSVYLPIFRNNLPELFDLFDYADPNVVDGNRNTSTLPTQALYMMNSDFVQDRAKEAAKRLLRETAAGRAGRVNTAFLWTLGRPPSADERAIAHRQIADPSSTDGRAQRVSRWARLFHGLFASVDFRYLH